MKENESILLVLSWFRLGIRFVLLFSLFSFLLRVYFVRSSRTCIVQLFPWCIRLHVFFFFFFLFFFLLCYFFFFFFFLLSPTLTMYIRWSHYSQTHQRMQNKWPSLCVKEKRVREGKQNLTSIKWRLNRICLREKTTNFFSLKYTSCVSKGHKLKNRIVKKKKDPKNTLLQVLQMCL